jgi:hypothetical protein
MRLRIPIVSTRDRKPGFFIGVRGERSFKRDAERDKTVAHGDKRIALIERKHVQALVDAKAATPGAARNLLSHRLRFPKRSPLGATMAMLRFRRPHIAERSDWRFRRRADGFSLVLGGNQPRRNNSEHGNQKQRLDRHADARTASAWRLWLAPTAIGGTLSRLVLHLASRAAELRGWRRQVLPEIARLAGATASASAGRRHPT